MSDHDESRARAGATSRRGRTDLPAIVLLATTGAIVVALSGCTTGDRRVQLERVAKDWSETIRASQVIPVYPPMEDLVPGDVFLVRQTVDEQHEQWEEDGYLPFTSHLVRIQPDGYAEFYRSSFGPVDDGDDDADDDDEWSVPEDWIRETDADGNPTPWASAPLAAFPTYSFAVKRGGAFDLALPIKGVPVAIGLTGAEQGVGTITMRDVRTYGLDTLTLARRVRAAWDEDADFRQLIAPFAAEAGEPSRYLRVVSRVYLVREFEVGLSATATSGGSATAGLAATASSPPDLGPGETDRRAMSAYEDSIESINRSLQGAGERAAAGRIGGSLTLVAASARSVSLRDTLTRPIVVGYLGFDMAIRRDEDGSVRLGPPIAVQEVLDDRTDPASMMSPFSDAERRYVEAKGRIEADAGRFPVRARAVLERLGLFVPTAESDLVEAWRTQLRTFRGTESEAEYEERTRRAAEVMERVLAEGPD